MYTSALRTSRTSANRTKLLTAESPAADHRMGLLYARRPPQRRRLRSRHRSSRHDLGHHARGASV